MKKRFILSAVIIIIAAAFIAAGAFMGEADTVLQNGIVICLECIGLG